MKNLILRTIFGALYVAAVVAVICTYSQYPYLFAALFSLFSFLAVREYHIIADKDSFLKWTGASLAVLMFLTVYFSDASRKTSIICASVYALLLIIVLVAELFRKRQPIVNWGHTLIGQAMIAAPFALMCMLANHNPHLLLAMFVIIWVNDTGAYCVGSLIGRHKMFVRVSPAKSWEGLVGGVVFSLVAGLIFFYTIGGYSLLQWFIIAFVISAFGTFGDLMESLLKRTIGIKDSGRFLPGHGGVLDRFDSALLAAPALYILLTAFSLI